jgi:hypothetical protein
MGFHHIPDPEKHTGLAARGMASLVVAVVLRILDCDKIDCQPPYQTIDAVLILHDRHRTFLDTGLDVSCYMLQGKG